jgi:lipid A ethanolaminephosphotransferase
VLAIYPANFHNLGFLISLFIFFYTLTLLFFLLVSYGKKGRWLIAILLILSAQAAYYMDNFGVLMDVVMIDNIMHTDAMEARGILNFGIISRTLMMGVLPAWLVIKFWPSTPNILIEVKTRLKNIAWALLTVILVILPFTAGYTSFIREHKITRFYANPTYPVYSVIKYGLQQLGSTTKGPITLIAQDAHFIDPLTKHELVIMVVGETARFDRFSLNGYHRLTNPLLAKENVISLSNVSSCGTSTGVSTIPTQKE